MAADGSYRTRSALIHGRFRTEKWDFQDHIVPPITTAVSFRLRSAERGAEGFKQFANPDIDRSTAKPIYIYDRLDEPCQGLLEETLAFAEEGECAVSFATGMAAISAAIGIHLHAGDHVIYHPAIYGCTYSHITNWLNRFGISSTAVDLNNLEELAQAMTPMTKVIFFESPCNPTMTLVDIRALVGFVKAENGNREPEKKVVTVIDNTFASPYGQRPLTMGVDYVVHSLTKHIGGFGCSMGGAVIGPRKTETNLLLYRKDFGGSLSPDAAWHILTYGVSSLAVRMDRQQMTAGKIASWLEQMPGVNSVSYPGLDSFPQKELAKKQLVGLDGEFAPGSMIYFDVEDYSRAVKIANWLAENSLAITLAVSLGQIRTLVEHPASMTHSALGEEAQKKGGLSPGGLRLSIGLEDYRDIQMDLEKAMAAT